MSESVARQSAFQRSLAWWLTAVVIMLVAAVRLRLLNFPLERDEGEYAYAGQLILQGIPPYELACNMKFPGTYLAYAAIMALFGQTPAGIHLGVMLLTTGTALMLFWLGKKILDETAGAVAACSYAVLAASPTMFGLAGHATHFCAFFATAGFCLMWLARVRETWWRLVAGGVLFGLSVLMKQHAVVIAAWAGLSFAAGKFFRSRQSCGRRLATVAVYGCSMLLPLGLCCLWLWRAGVFAAFKFWTFDYARQYATIVAPSEAWQHLVFGVRHALVTGFLILPFAVAGALLLWRDDRLRGHRAWVFGFGAASVLSIFPDFYFRKNYFLLMLPGVALLAGCAVSRLRRSWRGHAETSRRRWPAWAFAAALLATILTAAQVWFWLGPVPAAHKVYYGNLFPEAAPVAAYIREHSSPTNTLAVIGSEPEIYFLSHRHSATGFIYTYPLMEAQPFALEMQNRMINDIETNRPEFIVYADADSSWLSTPYSNLKIFNWWDTYKTNYTLVAVADFLPPTNSVYIWGTDMVRRYGGSHGIGLEVYQRR